MKKFEYLIVFIILMIALFIYLIYNYRGHTDVKAEILIDGRLYKTINLNRDQKIFLEEKPSVKLEVKDGQICFMESDCPDKICIKSGYLSMRGQSAACLPNRVSVRIVKKDNNNGFDAVVY